MRLVADNLGGERGGFRVFTGLDFELSAGEGLIVTGRNGSGKSTLLRIIAGLLPAADGSVRLSGGGDAFPDAGSAAHYLGHLNGMKAALTVAENLDFWRSFLGPADTDLPAALEAVGLGAIAHLPFGYLSMGQKRRAAIARLLVSRRPVWLLDEPTAGLDRESAGRFAELMREHLDSGGILVAATHLPLDLPDARSLSMEAPH